jgi:hypothetical protein
MNLSLTNSTKIIYLLAYTIATIFFSLIFLELFLRFVYAPEPVKTRIYMNQLAVMPSNFQNSFDDKIFKFLPKSTGEMLHPEYTISVSHDFFGFRNPCLSPSLDTTYSLLIGDSFVYGLGVEDKNTFSCQLNKNKEVKFYTLGIPGASPIEYLRMLNTHTRNLEKSIRIDKSKPLFVMIFLGNDFEGLLSLTKQPEPHTNQLTPITSQPVLQQLFNKTPLLERFNKIVTLGFLSNSYLAQSVKLSLLNLKLIRKSDGQAQFWSNYGGSTFYSKNIPLKVGEVKDALSYFEKEIKSLGYTSASFILIPDADDIDQIRLKRDASIGQFDPDQINTSFKFDSITKACLALQIYCLDVRPALESSLQNQMNQNYYISDGHLKPQGVANVSNYIISALKNKL